jgi:type I restriction enzyme S subunit
VGFLKAEIKEKIEMISRGEVPEGYKKTKVGIIPLDWEVRGLGELGRFFRGKGIPKSKIRAEGIGCITYGEIYTTYNYTVKKLKSCINEETANNSTPIKKNDILFAGSGETLDEIGKCIAYLGEDEAYAGGDIVIFRPKNTDGEILGYLLNQDIVNSQKYRLGQGHSVVHIYAKDLEDIFIPVYKESEQQKIAQILSTWDKAIELKEQIIEEKKEQKKGLIQRLLTGEVRMPGFYGEWKEVRLGEITNRISEKNKGRSNNVLTISAEHGLINQEEYFTKQVASSNLDNYIYLVKGDFAYNKSYSRGYPMGVIKMLEKYEEGVVSSLYICFRTKQNVIRNYLKQYFYGGMFNYEIFKIAQEGSRNHGLLNIAIKDFFNIRLNLPPLQEQKAIAQVLSTADKEIELLEEELEQLKLQKKGLMQLLLTGIIRVKS